jgi:hypothetical protein
MRALIVVGDDDVQYVRGCCVGIAAARFRSKKRAFSEFVERHRVFAPSYFKESNFSKLLEI